MKVLCPSDIHKYNQFMNGPDWCDQKKVTLEFDGRSKFQFYLQVFFNFFDIAFVNSKISYHKIVSTPALSTIQLDSRQSIAQKMIFNFPSMKRAIPTFRPTKRSIGESFGIANRLPNYATSRAHCALCTRQKIEYLSLCLMQWAFVPSKKKQLVLKLHIN